MNQLLECVFKIFILAIICAFINNLSVNDKLMLYVKPIVSVVIILTVINFISEIKINDKFDWDIEDFSIDTQSVWDQQAKICEQLLEKEMIEDCRKNNFDINEIDVNVIYKDNDFNIKLIKIFGKDKNHAKNYISGKYQVGLAYINIDGD